MVEFKKQFEFGSKAETLTRLNPLLTKSRVPMLLSFTVGDWQNGKRKHTLERIQNTFGSDPVIVRSSALSEDGSVTAQAGAFLSVPNIRASNRDRVEAVVDEVINSYRKDAANSKHANDEPDNQVIVQRMVQDVLISGVLFTQDLSTGAPYYVINYDDKTGRTESITSGSQGHNRTLYVFRDAWDQISSPRFQKILKAVREIEGLVEDTCLDIEFALDKDFNVIIFQVRQITTQPNWNRGLTLRIHDTIARLRESLVERYANRAITSDSDLSGTVLGNMPDWNPAEMIGTTPRPLAFSLYRRLITDRAWRTARRRMGYKENRGMPLMISLAGQPYIDVRQSFHSFLPEDLPDSIGHKLVEAWLTRLRENHHLHDKIEFDIAITTYSPDFDQRVERQIPGVLNESELAAFRHSLRNMTNDLLTGRRVSITEQLNLIETLARRREEIVNQCSKPDFETVSVLLEDAIEFGTVPFSILARHGFIASSFLRGLVLEGVLSEHQVRQLQRTIPTIATQFIHDIDRYLEGTMTKKEFLSKYGHLRPGTYDILSMRYDRRLSALAGMCRRGNAENEVDPFEIDPEQKRKINSLLQAKGIEIDADSLFAYVRAAIQGREYAKFVFTHNVSDALETIAAWGERYRLSREELSYIGIRDILDCVVEPKGRSIESHLRELSEQGSKHHKVTNSVRLPFLITRLSDLVIVPLAVEQPNYITRKNVRGKLVLVTGADLDPTVIDNHIVAIESADPGFDWIFTRPLLGLVTKFGGANSHMAIRCAEFGLPAAVGCGEQIFDKITSSGLIDLNCAEGQITAI